ncbi:unnamed protein product, partial [Hapterophycus canaliculatus]
PTPTCHLLRTNSSHRKACDHPHMLLDVRHAGGEGETEAQAVDKTVAASGKLALLDRMLPRLQV